MKSVWLVLFLAVMTGCAGQVAPSQNDSSDSDAGACVAPEKNAVEICDYLCRINVPVAHEKCNKDPSLDCGPTLTQCLDTCSACVVSQ